MTQNNDLRIKNTKGPPLSMEVKIAAVQPKRPQHHANRKTDDKQFLSSENNGP